MQLAQDAVSAEVYVFPFEAVILSDVCWRLKLVALGVLDVRLEKPHQLRFDIPILRFPR